MDAVVEADGTQDQRAIADVRKFAWAICSIARKFDAKPLVLVAFGKTSGLTRKLHPRPPLQLPGLDLDDRGNAIAGADAVGLGGVVVDLVIKTRKVRND